MGNLWTLLLKPLSQLFPRTLSVKLQITGCELECESEANIDLTTTHHIHFTHHSKTAKVTDSHTESPYQGK